MAIFAGRFARPSKSAGFAAAQCIGEFERGGALTWDQVGVDAQREGRRVVPENARELDDVNAVGELHRREGVA